MSVLTARDLTLEDEQITTQVEEEDVVMSPFEEDISVMMELYKEVMDRKSQKDGAQFNRVVGRSLQHNVMATEMGEVLADHLFDDPSSADDYFEIFKAYAPTVLEKALQKPDHVSHLHKRRHASGYSIISEQQDDLDEQTVMNSMLRFEMYRTTMKRLLMAGFDMPYDRWKEKRDQLTEKAMMRTQKQSSQSTAVVDEADPKDTAVARATSEKMITLDSVCDDMQRAITSILKQL